MTAIGNLQNFARVVLALGRLWLRCPIVLRTCVKRGSNAMEPSRDILECITWRQLIQLVCSKKM
jgi:hypothetical protein